MIYTHLHPDLDAACSVWAARKLIGRDDDVEFVPAAWKGPVPDGDLALDLDCGLKHGEETYSCFAELVGKYASEEEAEDLQPLVLLVEDIDSGRLKPARTGLNSVWYALVAGHDEAKALKLFSGPKGILDCIFCENTDLSAETETRDYSNGQVAILYDPIPGDMGRLFDAGASAVVYVDGVNLGVSRRRGVEARIDGDEVRTLIEEKARDEEWFFHPAGYLVARGTYKSPIDTPSKVSPEDLADAAAASLGLC